MVYLSFMAVSRAQHPREELLTVAQAARRLDWSEPRMRRFADAGGVPFQWTGIGRGMRMFLAGDIDALAAKQPKTTRT